ncbi:MAG TPA: carboxypeptidase-like regulatory domain-containing protein [Cyclobacteriaceae bacterium]|nr:carboxypeptidase-like regulatory domain-containing protein [Cyclobacteriaceae bacterium]
MFIKLLLAGIISLPISSFCQTHLAIKGRVIDEITKSPLPYANISIKNTTLGTVTNDKGEFEFFVPPNFKNDTLLVSNIGYKTFKDRISNLINALTIVLDEAPTILNEIIVSSEGPRELVEKALQAIPQIYPDSPYLMEGFHRSWEKVDFTDSISYPGTFIEAALTIYDPGYSEELKSRKREEEVYINEVRRSAINKGWNYSSSALTHLLKRNLVKHNDESAWNFLKSFLKFPNNLEYELEGETVIDDEPLFIVNVEIPNSMKFPASAKIYISTTDHAILRYDLTGEKQEVDYSIGSWHTQYLMETFVFSRYESFTYLRYASLHYIIKNLDTIHKKVLRTEEYHRELLVNNIITTDVEVKRKALPGKKSKDISLALQSGTYNETFWKTYNVIKENPLDETVASYFGITE